MMEPLFQILHVATLAPYALQQVFPLPDDDQYHEKFRIGECINAVNLLRDGIESPLGRFILKKGKVVSFPSTVEFGYEFSVVRMNESNELLLLEYSANRKEFVLSAQRKDPNPISSGIGDLIGSLSETSKRLCVHDLLLADGHPRILTQIRDESAVPIAVNFANVEQFDAHKLNPSQANAARAIINAVDGDLHIIQGPPGSGKTSIINQLVQWKMSNEEDSRVLITAPTNQALVPHLRLITHQTPFTLYVSKHRASMPEFVRYAHNISEDPKVIKSSRVILATLSRTFKLKQILEGVNIDLIVVDEAGKAVEPDTLFPVLLRPRIMALVGDHKQLRPTVHNNSPMFYCKSMMERIAEARGNDNILQLNVEYRCGKEIYQFSNTHCYGNKVTSDAEMKKSLLGNLGLQWSLPGRRCWIPVIGTPKHKKGSTSFVNYSEIKQVTFVLQNLKRRGVDCEQVVKVLSPYKDQIETMKSKLSEEFGDIFTTVSKYQGCEADIIIITMVQSVRSKFLADLNILNVANTRAKQVLLLIAHPELRHADSLLDAFLGPQLSFDRHLVAPIAKEIFSTVQPEVLQLLSYYDNVPLTGYKDLLTVKQIEADSQSAIVTDIPEEYLSSGISELFLTPDFAKSHENALFNAARLCMRMKHENALTVLSGIPDNAQLQHIILVMRYRQIRTAEDRSQLLVEIEGFDNDNPHVIAAVRTLRLHMRSRTENVLQDYNALYQESNEHLPLMFYWHYAAYLLRMDNQDRAAQVLDKVINDQAFKVGAFGVRDLVAIHCTRADIEHRKGNMKQTEDYLKGALKVCNKARFVYSWPHQKLAGLYMDQERPNYALHHARLALEIHPGNISAYRIRVDARDLLHQN